MLASILLMGLTSFAGPISQQAARKNAAEFLQKLGMTGYKKRLTAVGLPHTRAAEPAYYIFNTPGGFILVSGDDITAPIIGYSDETQFDKDNIPAGLREMLAYYTNVIEWARKQDIPSGKKGLKAFTPVERDKRHPIAPIVRTKWDQGYPYNIDCPSPGTSNDRESFTGCVATAMAQAIAVYRHPNKITKQIPGYKNNKHWDYPNKNRGPLPPTTFDWANIKDRYTGHESKNSPEAKAIANLMHYCGRSVKMNYGGESVGGSGALSSDVAEALKNYFGYNSNVRCVDMSNYSADKWEALLYRELAQASPIVLSGSSSSGGHAFICDGYDSLDYFHINWGWGGMSDGYFKLVLLDPDSLGSGGGTAHDGFASDQDAVIGIRPAGVDGNDELPDQDSKSYYKLKVEDYNIDLEHSSITFVIKNEGREEFAQDLTLKKKYDKKFESNAFAVIRPGETKEVSLSFANGNSGEYRLGVDTYAYYGQNIDYLTKYIKIDMPKESATTLEITFNPGGGEYDAPQQIEGEVLDMEITLANKSGRDYFGPLNIVLAEWDEEGGIPVESNSFNLRVEDNKTRIFHPSFRLRKGAVYNCMVFYNKKLGEEERVDSGYFTGSSADMKENVYVDISDYLYSTLYYGDRGLLLPEGLTGYTYRYEGKKLVIAHEYKPGSVIPAGTAILLHSKTPGRYILKATDKDGYVTRENALRGTDKTIRLEEKYARNYYIFSYQTKGDNSSAGFYFKETSGRPFTNQAHKAYLEVPQWSR